MRKVNAREKVIIVLSAFVLALIIKGIFDFAGLKNINEIKEQLIAVLQYFGMILMMVIPDLLERKFHFHIPDHVYLSVTLFAFLALVCGNGLHFYRIFPWWDTAEHFVSGISLGFLSYWLIDIVTSNRAHEHYFINTVLAILIALGCGGIWEMIEYTSDGIQGTNFQRYMKTGRSVLKKTDKPRIGRDALYDTMKDIFVDFGGASVGAVIVYVYKIKTKDAPYKNKIE